MNYDVDVTATLRRRWNTDDPIDATLRYRASLSFVFQMKLWLRQRDGTESEQDQHLIDTDKFELFYILLVWILLVKN
jgi:hypothetical protein